MALVSTQELPMYSVSPRAKLTLPQAVVAMMPVLFPPELQIAGKAELTMLFEGPNADYFVVTASLQKQGENGARVVLLESGWKPVVRELGLREGDKVSIYLLDNLAWTYSIEVERAPVRMEIDLNEPAQPDMDENGVLDLNEPAQLDMDENGVLDLHEPAQPDMDENGVLDLNEPAQPDMVITLNQPNQPVGRRVLDLNEPADPNM